MSNFTHYDAPLDIMSGAEVGQICFGLESLNPNESGWPAIWAIYNLTLQYLPILLSLGFFFLNWVSRSTLVHFLGNTTLLSWLISYCISQRFKEQAENPECVVSIKLSHLELIGSEYSFPPTEITQSASLIMFFVFYLFFWKGQWTIHLPKDGRLALIVKSEIREKTWFIIIIILLLVQNPLLLWLNSVYYLFEVTIAIIIGLTSTTSLILIYLFLMYMYESSIQYQGEITEHLEKMQAYAPFDDPFSFIRVVWIPESVYIN